MLNKLVILLIAFLLLLIGYYALEGLQTIDGKVTGLSVGTTENSNLITGRSVAEEAASTGVAPTLEEGVPSSPSASSGAGAEQSFDVSVSIVG